jgi:lipoprotein signal peptidase
MPPSTPSARDQVAASGFPGDTAIRSVGAHLRLWVVTAACLFADLASKRWAFHDLGPDEVRVLIPGLIRAHRSLNSGALFGAFSGWVWAFIVASVLALGFVVYFFACSGRRQRFLHLGLAFILAGALGNLYDRSFVLADVVEIPPSASASADEDIGVIVSEEGADPVVLATYPDKSLPREYRRKDIEVISRHGVVRDFIKFTPVRGVDYWPWVFNVADALLVVGVGILLISFQLERRRAGQAALAEAHA